MNDATLRAIPAGRADRIAFTGERRDFFRLVRRGVLLEAITAGFYRFWHAPRSLVRHIRSLPAMRSNIPGPPKSSCSVFCLRSPFWRRSISFIS
jgi:hypothetical protein